MSHTYRNLPRGHSLQLDWCATLEREVEAELARRMIAGIPTLLTVSWSTFARKFSITAG